MPELQRRAVAGHARAGGGGSRRGRGGRCSSVEDREQQRAGRKAARGVLVPAEDRFFLYVESPAAPQHVGGVALVDVRGLPEGRLSRPDLLALAEQMVRDLPPLRRRLSPDSRWRRPRWAEQAPDLDW